MSKQKFFNPSINWITRCHRLWYDIVLTAFIVKDGIGEWNLMVKNILYTVWKPSIRVFDDENC